MNRVHVPRTDAAYGFKFNCVEEGSRTWRYEQEPINPTVQPAAFFKYNSDYKTVYNCFFTDKNQSKVLYNVIDGIVFYIPMYYIKMDGSKQLIYKLKSENFNTGTVKVFDRIDMSVNLEIPELYETAYLDEFSYYYNNNQLNCNMIVNKNSGVFYEIETNTYPNIRVENPSITEVIFFV